MGLDAEADDLRFSRQVVEAALRVGVLVLIGAWTLQIVRPFAEIVIWAVILAVAIHPLYAGLARRLGGRTKLSAALVTAVALAILLVPSAEMLGVTVGEARAVAEQAEAGALRVPAPPAGVREWPLVGERTYSFWFGASRNLDATLETLEPEIRAVGRWGLSSLAGLTGAVVQFAVSIFIAGVLLVSGEGAGAFAVRFATRLAGAQGERFVHLAVATIRSVARGLLGIAVIQAALAALGLAAIGVPAAMLWALLVLILAIMQLPPLLVLGPIMVWAFATQGTVAAVVFLVYGLLVGVSDSFLKPLLLGRGLEVPTLVIVLGAVGGVVTAGLIGLFVAPIVLAVAYQLLMAWIEQDADRGTLAPAEPASSASSEA